MKKPPLTPEKIRALRACAAIHLPDIKVGGTLILPTAAMEELVQPWAKS